MPSHQSYLRIKLARGGLKVLWKLRSMMLREVTNILRTIEEPEKSAEDTLSTLLYMTLQAKGIKSNAIDHTTSHVGKASAFVLLLKSFLYHSWPEMELEAMDVGCFQAHVHDAWIREGWRALESIQHVLHFFFQKKKNKTEFCIVYYHFELWSIRL